MSASVIGERSRAMVYEADDVSMSTWPYAISAALVLIAAPTMVATLFWHGVLRGTAVMNGSARGTALVLLVFAVPLLAISMFLVARGSVRAVATWLGAATYTLYNSFLFLTATPFDQLFLLYVAMFGLSFWSLTLLLHELDVPRFVGRFAGSVPARPIAAFLGILAVLNFLAWLAQAVPAVLSDRTPAFLDGTGLVTFPTYVQDLSFWLPLTLVTAVWLWQRRPWGVVVAGALCVYGVIEGIGVATDQAFGHAADPASNVVVVAAIPGFLVLAAMELVAAYFYIRGLKKV